jgi:DNA repair exonuclease SbcCD ATPase subunit
VLGKLEADFETQQQLDLAEQVLKLQNAEQVSKAAVEEAHAKVKAAEDALAEDRSVEDTKKTLEERKQKLSAADEAHQKTIEDLKSIREEKAAHEGALKILRESAAKLDETAARNAVQQVETELKANPAHEPPVTEEQLAEVRQSADDARDALKNVEDEIHGKRGALQQVGGDISKQRAAEAAAQLETVKQRERQAELDFNAWELLRQALREAEQEESSHLGRLIAGPIGSRFSELTGGRYMKLALGPALETQGVRAGPPWKRRATPSSPSANGPAHTP